MRKIALSVIAGSITASMVYGTQLTVASGWNLVSTAGEENVSAQCILNKMPMNALLFGYDNIHKKWKAVSNSDSINQKIETMPSISRLNESLKKTEGYWIYNPSNEPKNVEIPCDSNISGENYQDMNNSILFTFGNDIIFDFDNFLQPGNIMFMFLASDFKSLHGLNGYDKIVVQSNNILEDKMYEYDYEQKYFQIIEDMNLSYNVLTNNSLHVIFPNGEEGNLSVFDAKELLAIEDQNVSAYGSKLLNMNFVVTKEGPIEWEEASWIENQNIYSIEALKNRFTDISQNYSISEEGYTIMFAVADQNATSGDLVEGQYDGYISQCYDDNPDHCKKYIRTDHIIGHWVLRDDGVLEADVTEFHVKKFWKEENGKFYEGWQEEPGAQYPMIGIIAQDPDGFESFLRQNIGDINQK